MMLLLALALGCWATGSPVDGEGKLQMFRAVRRGVNPVRGQGVVHGTVWGVDAADKMAYWRTTTPVPRPVSLGSVDEEQFVTFEPDPGGFNNIRMNFETVVAIAALTNRTLVLPPRQQMYLLHKQSAFEDLFDMEHLSKAVRLMPTAAFLERQGAKVTYSTDSYDAMEPLRDYLRSNAVNPKFDMENDVLAFPSAAACQAFEDTSPGHPLPSFRAFRGKRRVVEFDAATMESPVIHFQADKYHHTVRLFGLFYPFIYTADAAAYRYMVAIVRDHVHFRESVWERAALIVNKLWQLSNGEGFQALHVRRGDFQFKQTRVDPSIILQNVRPLLDTALPVYIATDEKNQTLFEEWKRAFPHVLFPSDMESMTDGVERRLFGLIDVAVCSMAKVFIGTELSTFSSYITRLRLFMDPSIVTDKNIYLTTAQHNGDPKHDSAWTDITWFEPREPAWMYSKWSREFPQFLSDAPSQK